MCETCGRSDGAEAKVLETGETLNPASKRHHGESHDHAHFLHDNHFHTHSNDDDYHDPARTVVLEQDVLAKNAALAARNRAWFAGREILALNLVSGPGSGKTTLLERTVRDLRHKKTFFVIGGDQATTNDGLRIKAAGAPVVQINTGSGCHLDADMVGRGVAELKPSFGSVLMIENVGNLVCPAMFDLGEKAKVAILSVTEGADKPIKYPHMFRAASLLLINKADLLPYVEFDLDRCRACARRVNPAIEIMTLSTTTGEGLAAWFGLDFCRIAPGAWRSGSPRSGGRAVIVSSSASYAAHAKLPRCMPAGGLLPIDTQTRRKAMWGKTVAAALALWCFAAGPAFAHVGLGQAAGFAHGFFHPLSGLDHIVAMVAVGLYAANLGGRNLWLVPSAFVVMMIFGGFLGYTGFHLPLVEEGIALSVAVMSMAVAAGFNLPTVAAMALVSLFALFHGHAHGSEGAVLSSFLPYAAGFVIATASLHFAGITLGLELDKFGKTVSLALKRALGVAGAFAGVAILAGMV
jgi:hydrogenase nickel incorporation protein HypB